MFLYLNVEKVLYSLWPIILSISFFTKVFTKRCFNICYSRHKKVEVINGFLTYQRTFLCCFFVERDATKLMYFTLKEWIKSAIMCRYLLNMTRFWLQLFIVKKRDIYWRFTLPLYFIKVNSFFRHEGIQLLQKSLLQKLWIQ